MTKPSWLRKPKWLRMPSVITLVFIVLVLQGIGSFIDLAISSDTNRLVATTTREERAVNNHRVRNEVYHDCLSDKLDSLVNGVNQVILEKADIIEIVNSCPEPLSEEELNHLRTEGDH